MTPINYSRVWHPLLLLTDSGGQTPLVYFYLSLKSSCSINQSCPPNSRLHADYGMVFLACWFSLLKAVFIVQFSRCRQIRDWWCLAESLSSCLCSTLSHFICLHELQWAMLICILGCCLLVPGELKSPSIRSLLTGAANSPRNPTRTTSSAGSCKHPYLKSWNIRLRWRLRELMFCAPKLWPLIRGTFLLPC